jgi:hypothetical protein
MMLLAGILIGAGAAWFLVSLLIMERPIVRWEDVGAPLLGLIPAGLGVVMILFR